MANNNPKIENLKKITDMTPEEKQKFSSKGGKKSQKNRKEAKAWKELAIIMLSSKPYFFSNSVFFSLVLADNIIIASSFHALASFLFF